MWQGALASSSADADPQHTPPPRNLPLGENPAVMRAGDRGDAMLIRNITLENVKCFSGSAHIDFTIDREDDQPHKWIVLYGDNGLGKSTLLKSIGLALTGQPALNALQPTAEGWVRGNQKYASIKVVAQKGPHDISSGFP